MLQCFGPTSCWMFKLLALPSSSCSRVLFSGVWRSQFKSVSGFQVKCLTASYVRWWCGQICESPFRLSFYWCFCHKCAGLAPVAARTALFVFSVNVQVSPNIELRVTSSRSFHLLLPSQYLCCIAWSCFPWCLLSKSPSRVETWCEPWSSMFWRWAHSGMRKAEPKQKLAEVTACRGGRGVLREVTACVSFRSLRARWWFHIIFQLL